MFFLWIVTAQCNKQDVTLYCNFPDWWWIKMVRYCVYHNDEQTKHKGQMVRWTLMNAAFIPPFFHYKQNLHQTGLYLEEEEWLRDFNNHAVKAAGIGRWNHNWDRKTGVRTWGTHIVRCWDQYNKPIKAHGVYYFTRRKSHHIPIVWPA